MGFAIFAAAALNFAGTRIRNLVAVAIASAFLIVAILFRLYHQPFELWPRIARAVGAVNSPSQTAPRLGDKLVAPWLSM